MVLLALSEVIVLVNIHGAVGKDIIDRVVVGECGDRVRELLERLEVWFPSVLSSYHWSWGEGVVGGVGGVAVGPSGDSLVIGRVQLWPD